MSTAQALRNLEHEIEAELARDLGQEKVVSIQRPQQLATLDPETELDRIASAHRQAIARRQQRISDTKKRLKTTIAGIAADRKAEKARHDAALADLADREAKARELAERDVEADQKMVASSTAALEALISE